MQLLTVDAFTAEPFRGNPAGVCFLDGARPDAWMQRVAAEMNLSNTAFVLREGDAFRLRWFTPTTEVPLCGHATLASAHALWSTGRLGADQETRFDTKSGRLTARRVGTRIQMDFPSIPVAPASLPPGAAIALGAKPVALANTVEAEQHNYILELESEAAVRGLAPYWSQKLGKTSLVGHQVSTRGGVVHVALNGDRVLLSGDAVTVLKGELAV